MSTEREYLRLSDIADNIDRIQSHIGEMTFNAFSADEKTIDAVERCLQRITEAILKIGPKRMAEISPQTPVEAVRGMGNALRHDYDAIDLRIIWTTATMSLPALRNDVAVALSSHTTD